MRVNEVAKALDVSEPYAYKLIRKLNEELKQRDCIGIAVRYYDLQLNLAAKTGNISIEERKKMLFWTKAEYQQFSDAMMDKPMSYYAF